MKNKKTWKAPDDWDKEKIYMELESPHNEQDGKQTFFLYWWGESIITNFVPQWQGQIFVSDPHERIQKYRDQGKEVVVFGLFPLRPYLRTVNLNGMNTKTNYHNVSFESDLKDTYSKYTNLAFTIDKDEEHNTWHLGVNSTSMSELDGSGEGLLQSYGYMKSREIREDIEQAKKDYPALHWDEI